MTVFFKIILRTDLLTGGIVTQNVKIWGMKVDKLCKNKVCSPAEKRYYLQYVKVNIIMILSRLSDMHLNVTSHCPTLLGCFICTAAHLLPEPSSYLMSVFNFLMKKREGWLLISSKKYKYHDSWDALWKCCFPLIFCG